MSGRISYGLVGVVIALASAQPASAQLLLARGKAVAYEYRLKPRACLPNLAVPAQGIPVRVIADQTMYPKGALAEAIVMRTTGATGLNWVGVTTAKSPQLAGGYAAGQQPLMWIDDTANAVDIEAQDGAHLRICHKPGSGLSEAAGTLMFVW
jgi:hypothetical protein